MTEPQDLFRAQLTQPVRRSARLQPQRPALVDGDRTWTWAAFADRIARLAGAFHALGVGSGDRVAMLADNCAPYVEFFYATLWSGGIAVPVNTRWALPEQLHCLDDAGPLVLLCDARHLSAARDLLARCPSIKALILIPGDSVAAAGPVADALDYEALIETQAPVADACRGGDDVACLFYTGGTTGRAKGVMLTHDNLMANSLVALTNMDMDEDTVHLHVSPLFHVAGGARVFSTTLAGGCHVPMTTFEPRGFLQNIHRHRVTLTIVVPTMLNLLLQALDTEPDLAAFDLSSLQLLTYGASPMPEALLKRTMARLPQVRFMQGYGMTESAPVISTLGARYHRPDGPDTGYLRSAGKPVYTAEVVIMDGNDQPLPTGAVGEVCVRGPMVMKGYWGQPELTAETLRNGWLHTGDAGYLDEQGFLFLVDRVKDMIVTGGENVYSAEVEAALYQHPDVLECAVIGLPDERWGEAVAAVVVPKAGRILAEADLDQTCRTQIAGYKCPKRYVIQAAPLPKSGAGKILKAELKAPYWQGQDRQVN